jgi:hypothetical protein
MLARNQNNLAIVLLTSTKSLLKTKELLQGLPSYIPTPRRWSDIWMGQDV